MQNLTNAKGKSHILNKFDNTLWKVIDKITELGDFIVNWCERP